MRRVMRYTALTVALLAGSWTVIAQGQWTWNTETIRTTVDNWDYWYLSLAFSADNKPAIAYSGRVGQQYRLKFAAFNGQSWIDQLVDAKSEVDSPSLLFNPVTGYPTIAYGGTNLKLAKWDGQAWRLQVVDANKASDPHLAFFMNGGVAYPAISYVAMIGTRQKQQTWLKFAWLNGASWVIEPVDTMEGFLTGSWNALAYSPVTGKPAIAYAMEGASQPWPQTRPSTLKFAVRDNGWQRSVIDSEPGAGMNVGLAYDRFGTPAIVDRSGPDYNHTTTRYFQGAGGQWLRSEIVGSNEDGGYRPQLKFDPNGQALVTYLNGGNYNELMIARLVNGVWMREPILSSPPTQPTDIYDEPSFALSTDGRPAVAYRHHPIPTVGSMIFNLRLTRSW